MRIRKYLTPHAAAASILVMLFNQPLAAQQPDKPPAPPINPAQARLGQTIEGLGGAGQAVVYNEEAGILAAGCLQSVIPYWDKGVVMGVRVGDGTPNVLKGHQGTITALAWNGGPVLVSAGADRKVIFWEMPEGKPVATVTTPGIIRALAMSPDHQTVAGGGDESLIYLWDVATGKEKAKLSGQTDWALALAFSPDGQTLASGGYDGLVRLWNVSGGQPREFPSQPPPAANQPAPPPNPVWALAFSPDGKTLALGGSNAVIYLVNPADGKIIRPIPGHTGTITSLVFHPGGAVLVSGSKDRTVRLWNPANGQALKTLEGHQSWVQDVVFLVQGTRLASVSADQTVKLWDLTNPM
ncbi:MAG: WD40 repeat domain-containing protein [Gemmataceae bacterium]